MSRISIDIYIYIYIYIYICIYTKYSNHPGCHHRCFLVTYFYTQKLIGSDQDAELSTINRKLFVETYGAYLQIQTCLSLAASVKDEAVISVILDAARNDPNHQDAVKEIQKSNDLLFYDSVSFVYSIVITATYFSFESI